MDREQKFYYLLTLFISTLIVANIIAGIKLVTLLGLIVPSGIIAYSVTFPITDIVAEVWGKRRAFIVVVLGFVANLWMLLMIAVGYILPPLEPEMQETYSNALIPAFRIVFASMIAYWVSQTHDVIAFHWWKTQTSGRWLWLRNNASTIVSQLIDTVVFITLAFYGVVPNNILLNMIVSQWLIKVLIALCDTPFVYLGVRLVDR